MTNKLSEETIQVLEILGSAITENMAYEEIGELAINDFPEGFVIYLN